jgi:hypothetical protein
MSEISESSDSFVKLREDLRINDIDLPLFKYEIINEETIDHLLSSGGNKRNKSYKTYSLIALILLNIIRYITYTFVSINGKVVKSYLNLAQYMGGITQFHYLETLVCLILILAIIILFNYSSSMQWIEIIGILNGNTIMERMRNSDFEYWEKFINRIKFIRIIIKLAVYFSVFFYIQMSIILVIISHDLIEIFKYGITGISLYISLGVSVIFIVFYSFLYCYIVCYYCRMKFRIFNNFLEQEITNKMFIKYKVIDELFREHNSICNKIILYNKFWKHYFFAINYTLIPLYLLVLQQIIFEEINFPVFITLFSGLIGSLGTHLMINSLIASINKESSKSYKSLHNFYIKLIILLNPKRKIKVYFLYYLWLLFKFFVSVNKRYGKSWKQK